jgi:hypothetical protein
MINGSFLIIANVLLQLLILLEYKGAIDVRKDLRSVVDIVTGATYTCSKVHHLSSLQPASETVMTHVADLHSTNSQQVEVQTLVLHVGLFQTQPV